MRRTEDTIEGKDIIFEEAGDPLAVIFDLVYLLSSPVDVMAVAERDGIILLNLKKTGSISYDMKHKSLIKRWPTPHRKRVENADSNKNPHLKVIQRNAHVKLEIYEGKGTTAMRGIENYSVLAT